MNEPVRLAERSARGGALEPATTGTQLIVHTHLAEMAMRLAELQQRHLSGSATIEDDIEWGMLFFQIDSASRYHVPVELVRRAHGDATVKEVVELIESAVGSAFIKDRVGESPVVEANSGYDGEMAQALHRISEAIERLDLDRFPAWREISLRLNSPELFGIDYSESAFRPAPDGQFDGRADLLLTGLTKGAGGDVVKTSFTVPARISGRVTANEVTIESVAVRLDA